jgi:hypothetical protein
MKLPGPGFYSVTGLAWSGRGRVQSVDVSVDAGKTWMPARIDTVAEADMYGPLQPSVDLGRQASGPAKPLH